MAGRGDEACVREGGKVCERAAEDSEVGAGLDEAWGGVEGRVGSGEDIGRPLAVEGEELGVAGVGCFGYGATAEAMEDVFGEVEPGEGAVGGSVREELVGSVDTQ